MRVTKEARENFDTNAEVIWAGGLSTLESARWRRRVIQLSAVGVLLCGWCDELADDASLLTAVARERARMAADEEV